MEENSFLHGIYEWFKRFSPFLLVGIIGAFVHRLRNPMAWKAFLSSVIIAMLVSLCVGVVCQEYTGLKEDVIYVLCGISGTFSKLLLAEIEEIIGDISLFVRERVGIKRKSDKEIDNSNNGGQEIPDER